MSSEDSSQSTSQEDMKRAVADALKEIPSFDALVAAAAKLTKEVPERIASSNQPDAPENPGEDDENATKGKL